MKNVILQHEIIPTLYDEKNDIAASTAALGTRSRRPGERQPQLRGGQTTGDPQRHLQVARHDVCGQHQPQRRDRHGHQGHAQEPGPLHRILPRGEDQEPEGNLHGQVCRHRCPDTLQPATEARGDRRAL